MFDTIPSRLATCTILAALGLAPGCASDATSPMDSHEAESQLAHPESAPADYDETRSQRVAQPSQVVEEDAEVMDYSVLERKGEVAVAPEPSSAARLMKVLMDEGAPASAAQDSGPSSTRRPERAKKRSSRTRRERRARPGAAPRRSSSTVAPKQMPPVVVSPPEDPSAGTEGYKDHGVNDMTETLKDRFSTFAVDVDTGAYTIARRKLNERILPPSSSVRVEEFVNYFAYDYTPPSSGAFSVDVAAAPSPFSADPRNHVVRVGVQGKKLAPSQRKPVHLTFLVDVSGSMNSPDKLGLAKRSLQLLTNNLRPGDTVALATYAGANRLVLPATSVSEKSQIMRAIEDLTSGGGTAMSSGMELAYQQAMASFKTGHVNRVIVLSDGDANIGSTSYDQILKAVQGYVAEGVTLSTIGLGMGNYKDHTMEQLANKGNGNYYYIDSFEEAKKVFGKQIDGTLEVIAKDVKIQVEFDPKAVSHYRLIGYENRDIADRDFRNDKVDAGEIGAGHQVTALYEVILDTDYEGTIAHVRIRAKKPDGFKAQEQVFPLTSSRVAKSLSDAPKDLQFATAVAGFAEILRDSPYAEKLSFALVEEVARASSSATQKDRQEFLALVRRAKSLR